MSGDATGGSALRDEALAKARAMRDGARWVVDNAEVTGGSAVSSRRTLLRCARDTERLAASAGRPQTVSVFGPSQSGKSYLMSVMTAPPSQRALTVSLGNERLDFLQKINPEGEKESTGLVTRFTVRRFGVDAERPVSVSLLSETDIVKILANTYLADSGRDEDKDLDDAAVTARLDELERRAGAGGADALDDDDVLDLQDYLERSFPSDARVSALKSGYWERAARLAPRLAVEDRARLFGFVWGDIEPFSRLYVRLQSALARLGFESEAACGAEALLPRETSIINVLTLDEGLHRDEEGAARLRLHAGDRLHADLPRSVAAALVAEIRFTLPEAPYPLFEHVDLLDFPGGRSRQDASGSMADALRDKPGKLSELFLRGKVAYLYERYLAEREITSMVLCIAPSVQEVSSLPRMITDWVHTTHGETPEERAAVDTALFIALTKNDETLDRKPGEDLENNPGDRWESRVMTAITKFLGSWTDWHVSWRREGDAFDNTFFVRNPAYEVGSIFGYENDRQTGISERGAPRERALRSGFLGSALVRRHVADPDVKWDSLLAPDGGVGLLIERLGTVCRPGLKASQVSSQIARLERQSSKLLFPHWVSDDGDERARRRVEQVERAVRELEHVQREGKFGALLHRLMIDRETAARLYRTTLMAREPEYDETEERRRYESRPARRYAAAVIAEWSDRMQAAVESVRFRKEARVPREALAVLVDELLAGAVRTHLLDSLSEALIDTGRKTTDAFVDAARMALTATAHVNRFVNEAGYGALGDDERAALDGAAGALRGPPVDGDALAGLSERPEEFVREREAAWCRIFLTLATGNAFGGARVGPDRTAQNEELAELLAALGRTPGAVTAPDAAGSHGPETSEPDHER